MFEMEVDHISAVAHDVGGETNVGAVEVETCDVTRKADAGGAADDHKILIDAHHFVRECADALVGAMLIRDDADDTSNIGATGIPDNRPVRIYVVEFGQSAVETAGMTVEVAMRNPTIMLPQSPMPIFAGWKL